MILRGVTILFHEFKMEMNFHPYIKVNQRQLQDVSISSGAQCGA